MGYDKKEDTYTEDFLEEIKPVEFKPGIIPGINDPQINQDISVEL